MKIFLRIIWTVAWTWIKIKLRTRKEIPNSEASEMTEYDENKVISLSVKEEIHIDPTDKNSDDDHLDATHHPRYLWVLDNGHGKLTKGKKSPEFDDGRIFYEWEFTRDIVNRMIPKLEALGVKYNVLVPEVNVDNFLRERVDRFNAIKTDLPKILLSVHSNAYPVRPRGSWSEDSNPGGIEVWYYHGSSRGARLAQMFQKSLVDMLGWADRGIKSKSKGQFYVLRNVKSPSTSILTESGFYNVKHQANELMKEEVREAIAQAHVDAIWEVESIEF